MKGEVRKIVPIFWSWYKRWCFFWSIGMNMRILAVVLIAIFFITPAFSAIKLDFSDLSQWDVKVFERETHYQPVNDPKFSEPVLHGKSENGASGLLQETDIDLNKTPWLSYWWKVESFPGTTDEKLKVQDDFAWRVSVTVTPGITMMSSKTIVYVWTPNQPEDSAWGNPFAPKQFKMLAATATDQKDTWVKVTRNVREDFKRLYGEDFDTLTVVAATSDSDNTHSTSSAFLSTLFFSESPN